MKIKIDSLDAMHDFLRIEQDLEYPENPEYKINQEKNKMTGIACPPVNLPPPLDDIGLQIKRTGTNYSATIVIDSYNPTIFNGTYKRLSKRFSGQGEGYKFILKDPSKDNSIGALYNSDNDYEYDISGANENSIRLISMGTRGAHTKEFPTDATQFIKDLRLLENIVNIFLKNLLEPVTKEEHIQSLEDMILYINP